jgi:putative endonuclease
MAIFFSILFTLNRNKILYFVYILLNPKTSKFYIGHTDNLKRRIEEHNTGCGGKYTRQNGPWILVYSEPHPDRSSAMKRERYLKSTKGSWEKKKLARMQQVIGKE